MLSLTMRSILAVCFTGGVFLLMSYLIAPDEVIEEPGVDNTQISITRKKRDETSEQFSNELTPPAKQEAPPPQMMAMAIPKASMSTDGFSFEKPDLSRDTVIGTNLNSNRRAISMVAIPPEYPQSALTKQIEGWVLLEFTIGVDGSVEEIQVVDAEPKGTFERAAIRAMKRWRYQPKMVDGRPIAQHHMREIFRFEIEN